MRKRKRQSRRCTGWSVPTRFWSRFARAGSRRTAPDLKRRNNREISLAVMPEIDHRIGQGLERVVQPTEPIKAQQQAPELVFPGEHPFDRLEPLVENHRVEEWLAAALGLCSPARVRVDVGDHAAVKN